MSALRGFLMIIQISQCLPDERSEGFDDRIATVQVEESGMLWAKCLLIVQLT